MAVRVRAPELRGAGGWLNTGGRSLSLAELRGKIVLLDFWTFCCVNCLHVLDELRELEREFSEELVVIGVHSPKFVHEADHSAVEAAIERYGVHHPVLDDPDLLTWREYAVRAWPTLVVVDPDGYIVAEYSGEGHLHALQTLVRGLVGTHDIRRGENPYVAPEIAPGTLRFPSKVVPLPDGNLAIADAGHHRITVLHPDGETLLRTVGDGEPGLRDGAAEHARFNEPNGLCLLPPEVAREVGYGIVVADTVNHCLRGIADNGTVSTLAGNGKQWMQFDGAPTHAAAPMSSPWDVVWSPLHDGVVIAMAGIHQLWLYKPVEQSLSVLAGTTNEGLVDGVASTAWMAQTSGLAVAEDGSVWMADAETSSLRRLVDGQIETHVGTGLFDFGLRDGAAHDALLQHPLGVCVLPDGSIGIADTYNGAVRRYDPSSRTVSTCATGLREPSDVVYADGSLLVCESAAHRLIRVPLDSTVTTDATAYRTQRPATAVQAGVVELRIAFTPPQGQKLDERYGPATHVIVSSTPDDLLLDGAYAGPDLSLRVRFNPRVAHGVLHVAARAAACDVDAEFPACHVHQQDWGVPVLLDADGADVLTLALGG